MRLTAPVFRLKREAKALSRAEGVPLHQALDRLAIAEGFSNWGHLASAHREASPASTLFESLNPGDMTLLAARPGHGKTILALELAVEAAKAGRRSWFFTLEFTEAQVGEALDDISPDAARLVSVDASEAINAQRIVDRAFPAGGRNFIVVDYLQLMDQRRSDPELSSQVDSLRDFAAETGAIIVAISQIARSFERDERKMPGVQDVRLPNPVDLGAFTRTCFLHDGVLEFGRTP